MKNFNAHHPPQGTQEDNCTISQLQSSFLKNRETGFSLK